MGKNVKARQMLPAGCPQFSAFLSAVFALQKPVNRPHLLLSGYNLVFKTADFLIGCYMSSQKHPHESMRDFRSADGALPTADQWNHWEHKVHYSRSIHIHLSSSGPWVFSSATPNTVLTYSSLHPWAQQVSQFCFNCLKEQMLLLHNLYQHESKIPKSRVTSSG